MYGWHGPTYCGQDIPVPQPSYGHLQWKWIDRERESPRAHGTEVAQWAGGVHPPTHGTEEGQRGGPGPQTRRREQQMGAIQHARLAESGPWRHFVAVAALRGRGVPLGGLLLP